MIGSTTTRIGIKLNPQFSDDTVPGMDLRSRDAVLYIRSGEKQMVVSID